MELRGNEERSRRADVEGDARPPGECWERRGPSLVLQQRLPPLQSVVLKTLQRCRCCQQTDATELAASSVEALGTLGAARGTRFQMI